MFKGLQTELTPSHDQNMDCLHLCCQQVQAMTNMQGMLSDACQHTSVAYNRAINDGRDMMHSSLLNEVSVFQNPSARKGQNFEELGIAYAQHQIINPTYASLWYYDVQHEWPLEVHAKSSPNICIPSMACDAVLVPSAESCTSFQEDSQELEALLSSDEDEEDSTGHSYSPKRFTGRSEGWCSSHRSIQDHLEMALGDEVVNEEQTRVGKEEYEVNSWFGVTAQRPDSGVGKLQPIKQSSMTRCAPLMRTRCKRTWRKRRVRRSVQLLKEVIPGAEFMDTLMVLEKTINYLKALQEEEIFESIRLGSS